ncbi:MAG TPA: bifunctional hydroxymethylpyrimidine kinase/phosphomethylpyrimidine kinase [Longimicrobiales bacterium]|nr:bifunctional hydroxymethylpyrimidine kinase/phosphomethylpyrimidine kinase [Longimicrobiales bacterium]
MKKRPIPVTLTIAGSDSGGGAGIQADLKAFQAFGTFGTTAITAITVQDTRGVHDVHAVPVGTVQQQIQVVADDLAPDACKTGMLATAELVDAVAAEIRAGSLPCYVLDPVMVATSGDRLLDRDAESAVAELLVPLATLVTPNLSEASLLWGAPVRTESDMVAAGEAFCEMGAGAALVKGGHLRGPEVVDVLVDEDGVRKWRYPRLETAHTHGTGCTLSAAIAAGLAHGRPLREAVEDGLDYVHRAIAAAPGLGSGHGPLNHLVEARPQPT